MSWRMTKEKDRGRVFIPVSALLALLALLVLWSVYQRFDVFFWCGDRCYAIFFHKKVQNIRRQKRR